VLIGGGVGVMLIGCILAGVVGFVLWPKKDGGGNVAGAGGNRNPALTQENLARITAGMTRKEVEDILGGPGEKASLKTVSALIQVPDDPGDIVPPDVANHPGVSFAVWRNERSHIVVAFVPSKQYGDLVMYIEYQYFRGSVLDHHSQTRLPVATIETIRKDLEQKKKKA
jgi:hypothetical protein